ncbi:efflux RND transporter permease subunit [Salinimonas sp. HHU 13199]|uniref:Efflux RND transporter permease subunit n=1 Tax=Salinimonas profundi TaxID=2729140 RepID=A0ABR8LEK4_9ALTE|nr:efflux RND transporter permease subunit [Salinimonas profundi]MBD3584714.1 efflux RND transporter permease subunit [Salinimonas profundi]
MDDKTPVATGMARFALTHPVTVCMVFLSLLLFGIIASRLLPLEKFPGIDIPEMVVNVPYDDATPSEIERMITRPIEEAVATLSGIKRIQSRSFDNRAEIYVEFNWDENIKAKSIEAREKIDGIRHLLPDDVERILVFKFNTNDMPIFQLRVSSERDLSNAYDLLDRNLKRAMERVPGISKVELYGVMKKQIIIRLKPQRMAALDISAADVTRQLQQANFAMSAGQIDNGNQQIRVSPQGEFSDIRDFAAMPVKGSISLSDIADINYEQPEATEGRHLDRTYAVGFNVYRESGSNLVDVSSRVLEVIEDAKQDPAFNGINLFVMDDVAKSVTTSLSDLLWAGVIGAVFSVAILYLFLRQLSTTLIVVLSVPVSLCITLGVMYLAGYSLNVLSLMGLMLAVGMLVDNAVVITESIFNERQFTNNRRQATLNGINKVSLAVIAGTTTTAIVFLPNIIGVKIDVTVFLEHVAIAICISLFASLLIAQTLIPLLAEKIKTPSTTKPVKEAAYQRYYQKILAWVIAHRKSSACIALVILVSTLIPMQVVSSDGQGNDDNKRVWLTYHFTQGYSLEEVEKSVDKMEAFLYANQDKFHIEQVYSWFTAGEAVSGITLKDDLPVPIAQWKTMVKDAMPEFARARPSFNWQSDNGGGLQITLTGDSTSRLLTLGQSMVAPLSAIEGLEDVKLDVGNQQQEVQIRIDRERAHRLGLDAESIAGLISTALRGVNLRTFRHGSAGEVDVRLMYSEDTQTSVSQLQNIRIASWQGKPVTLANVASVTTSPQLSEIQRINRQTALMIKANLGEDLTLEEARERIAAVMAYQSLPDGYSWSLDGAFQHMDEAQQVMQVNMLLAICMIYIVMAALFESLLLPTAVIGSLLFSFTGVFWTFMVTGTSMSIMAMIGMLILMGIVVNNGIVLVDRINQLVNEGMDMTQAVLQGCQSRVRPVLMTVATTVLGLVPLAIGTTRIGGDGPAYSPMAIAIIGGLLFSTLTSLFLVPLTYIQLVRLRQATARMIYQAQHRVRHWTRQTT